MPFPDTHEHAGKYYLSFLPAGDVDTGLKRTGARLAEPNDETDAKPWSPGKGELVTVADTTVAELKIALEDWKEVKKTLQTYGKQASARAIDRQVTANKAAVEKALKDGNDEVGRSTLQVLENTIETATASVAAMLPAYMPPPPGPE